MSISSLALGGAQTFLVRLADNLVNNNFVCIYDYEVCDSRGIDNVLSLIPDQVEVVRLPRFFDFLGKKINYFLHFLGISFNVWLWIKELHLKFILSKYNIEIINSHLYHSDAFISSCLKTSEIPFVITDHGDYRYVLNKGITTAAKVKEICNRANKIVCISDNNLQLMQELVTSKDKCTKIYNGISFIEKTFPKDARKKLGISEDTFVFGMVARGIPEKGWETAITAFKSLAYVNNIYLILVGSSEYLNKLESECKTEKNIYFVGHASEPFYWIDAFDVGLLPTYFAGESLPNSIIEYLILGKPTIATAIGGIPEMLKFQNRQSGLTIKLNDSHNVDVLELAKAMELYFENRSLLMEHSKNAILNSKRFNISLCAASYEALFNKLINL
ncbi:glycosyltransferase family 4 protein [Sphaerospermopsis aphanizomenoides BCCUSP55]|nr:glycosyltransferase family 4 protein [Sphaerospermopsis aphanizomenoides BCCUSP55]